MEQPKKRKPWWVRAIFWTLVAAVVAWYAIYAWERSGHADVFPGEDRWLALLWFAHVPLFVWGFARMIFSKHVLARCARRALLATAVLSSLALLVCMVVHATWRWTLIGNGEAWIMFFFFASVLCMGLWGYLKLLRYSREWLLALFVVIPVAVPCLLVIAFSLSIMMGWKDTTLYETVRSPSGAHEVVVLQSGLMNDTYRFYPRVNALFCQEQENGELDTYPDEHPTFVYTWTAEDRLIVTGEGASRYNRLGVLLVNCDLDSSLSVQKAVY